MAKNLYVTNAPHRIHLSPSAEFPNPACCNVGPDVCPKCERLKGQVKNAGRKAGLGIMPLAQLEESQQPRREAAYSDADMAGALQVMNLATLDRLEGKHRQTETTEPTENEERPQRAGRGPKAGLQITTLADLGL